MSKHALAGLAAAVAMASIHVGELAASYALVRPPELLGAITPIHLAQSRTVVTPNMTSQAGEEAFMWCTDNWEDGGWTHDFDILYSDGALCFEGSPNTIHLYTQPNYCGLHHYPGTFCPGW